MLRRGAGRGHQPGPRRVPHQPAQRARRGARRRAAGAAGAGAPSRRHLRAVDADREGTRRRAVAPLRGSPRAGQEGTHHQAASATSTSTERPSPRLCSARCTSRRLALGGRTPGGQGAAPPAGLRLAAERLGLAEAQPLGPWRSTWLTAFELASDANSAGKRHPAVAAAVVDRLHPVRAAVLAIAALQPSISRVGGADAVVRPVDQQLLHRPHVAGGEAPVVAAHRGQVHHAVGADPAAEVDVRVDVAERQRAGRRKHRPAAVETGVARAGDRPPAPWSAVDVDDVVEPVDRLEAEQQRRMAVLLERRPRRRAPPPGSEPCRARRRRGRCGASRRPSRGCRAGRSATVARRAGSAAAPRAPVRRA